VTAGPLTNELLWFHKRLIVLDMFSLRVNPNLLTLFCEFEKRVVVQIEIN
jgi:hypothetical protein